MLAAGLTSLEVAAGVGRVEPERRSRRTRDEVCRPEFDRRCAEVQRGVHGFSLQKILALVLAIPISLIATYVRIRHGRDAAEHVRRSAAESEAAGRAWRRRADVRLSRRLGWATESDGGGEPRDRVR